MAEIVLAGCATAPLASYLKALGILRLVAEQKDKSTHGFWRDEAFVLDTALRDEELVRFFLDEYCPSPIISPWNGGSGFYFRVGKSDEKDPETGKRTKTGKRDEPTAATRIVDSFAEARSSLRLALYRVVISRVRDALRELDLIEAPVNDNKRDFVMRLRALLPEECLAWIDAAVALTGETLGFPPLLGSGGNDGNLDFSSNFMQRLSDVIDPASGTSKEGARRSLRSALFGSATTTANKGAIGQFAPGAAGGPNATTGFERSGSINSWDYILMLEGALLFAASATRRLGVADSGAFSFPFAVRTTSAAGAAAIMSDEGDARGEIWLPLWGRSASLAEIAALLSEGRATLGSKPVQDGMDFARAAASLGVNRGVAAFERFAFLQRSGKAYVAAPMSRIRVQLNPRVDLLNDLDRGAWLQSFRRYARSANAPVRLRSIAMHLDEAIFAMAQEASPRAIQRVLIAVGEAVAYLASSPKARDPKEGKQKPPPGLSRDWFEAANDGDSEFRIAAALAGLGRKRAHADAAGDVDSGKHDDEIGEEDEAHDDDTRLAESTMLAEERRSRAIDPPPLRAHLAPLDEKSWYNRFRKWSDKNATLAVWGGGALDRNLIAVMERRLLFAAQRKVDGEPFDGRAPADLASVLAFLGRETDDERIAALVQGLAWADAPATLKSAQGTRDPPPLPLAYALLKPLFAPIDHVRTIERALRDIHLPLPPGLVARMRAKDIGAAVTLACRRARASGLPVSFEPRAHVASVDGPRLLAGLLIPIRAGEMKRVLERAYPALFDNAKTPTEDSADAA